jgi:hypothetical protein
LVYVIYWMEEELVLGYGDVTTKRVPHAEEVDDILLALKCAEKHRQRQFAGEKVSHITLMSENPNSVGKPGVDVVGPDYNWKKRRP